MDRKREFAITILDLFENLLEEKDITIPSDDREGNDSEARLYGCEYACLEDDIVKVLDRFERGENAWTVIEPN
jgi:hypothetical protein